MGDSRNKKELEKSIKEDFKNGTIGGTISAGGMYSFGRILKTLFKANKLENKGKKK